MICWTDTDAGLEFVIFPFVKIVPMNFNHVTSAAGKQKKNTDRREEHFNTASPILIQYTVFF